MKKDNRISLQTVDHSNTKAALETINEYFAFANLQQTQNELWKWLQATVTGSFNRTLTFNERTDLLDFYSRLSQLVAAVYALHQKSWKENVLRERELNMENHQI